MPMGARAAKKPGVLYPPWSRPTMGASTCMAPMPAREPMVLNRVNMGRCLGSLVSTVCPERVQEVWKVYPITHRK